jgi:hypothetical protein
MTKRKNKYRHENLSNKEFDTYDEIANSLATAIAFDLKKKLGCDQQESRIYTEEIIDAAYDVLYELTKEVTAQRKERNYD